MCRILSVTSDTAFECRPHLEKLSEISSISKEYQGHGWGCSWWDGGAWRHYKNLRPIWEDDFSRFGPSTRLVAHARSASLDHAIVLEYNMPYYDERYVYVFNGGLRGVTLKTEGRIGAEARAIHPRDQRHTRGQGRRVPGDHVQRGPRLFPGSS
jgi:glutamine amidotransferase